MIDPRRPATKVATMSEAVSQEQRGAPFDQLARHAALLAGGESGVVWAVLPDGARVGAWSGLGDSVADALRDIPRVAAVPDLSEGPVVVEDARAQPLVP